MRASEAFFARELSFEFKDGNDPAPRRTRPCHCSQTSLRAGRSLAGASPGTALSQLLHSRALSVEFFGSAAMARWRGSSAESGAPLETTRARLPASAPVPVACAIKYQTDSAPIHWVRRHMGGELG